MKLKITIVAFQEVESLEPYEATSLQEAAKNQAAWFADGTSYLPDILDLEELTVTVEGVE